MSKKITSPFTKYDLLPQEETLEIAKQKGSLVIGIPKETHYQEKRVCLTPDAVGALTAQGHKFVIETGAGDGANFSDSEYSEAGAKISYDVKEAFGCNIILKVEPPSLEEIEYINPQSILFSALQLKTQTKKYFEGWYFKFVLPEQQTALAIIPGISKDEAGKQHAFIQVLDGKNLKASYHKFDAEDFRPNPKKHDLKIQNNKLRQDSLSWTWRSNKH